MESIYQHFRKEERPFIDQVLEWCHQVETQYSMKLTNFLDPREQEIVQSIVGKNKEIKVSFWGGFSHSERKRAIIYPDYFSPEEADFQVILFEIKYPVKFVTIEHRQVLGALMSCGLKRSKYGDILYDDDQVQFILALEVADFIKMNLKSIGKAKINLQEIPITQIINQEDVWIEQSLTLSSLRLDTIVAQALNLPRQKVLPLIQSGRVKLNWKVIENPSFEAKEGDNISVRGFGRIRILKIDGKTKKDKWKTVIGRQK